MGRSMPAARICRVAILERIATDNLSTLDREYPIEPGANRFVVFDRIVEQNVACLPTLLVVAPLGTDSTLHLGCNRRGERVGTDAGDAGLRILGAQEDGNLAGLLCLQQGRCAVVVVASAEDHIGPLTQHL